MTGPQIIHPKEIAIVVVGFCSSDEAPMPDRYNLFSLKSHLDKSRKRERLMVHAIRYFINMNPPSIMIEMWDVKPPVVTYFV